MPVYTDTEVVLDTELRLKAVANDTRATILRVLQDGPASAKQLSLLLGMSHGKIGHHVKVLREAGLIEVVEERPVRAVTERIYGLAFTRLRFDSERVDRLQFTLAQAAREALPAAQQPFDPPALLLTVRMSEARAAEFNRRLRELADEFEDAEEHEGAHRFGLAASVFVTDTPR